jgi:TldD protein
MSKPDPAYRAATSRALSQVLAAAEAEGTYVIGRAQEKRETSLLVINGRTEHLGVTRLKGLGVQAFTREGHTGFAASDDLKQAGEVARTAARLARLAQAEGMEPNGEVFGVPKLLVDEVPPPDHPMPLSEQAERLRALNEEVRAIDPRLSVRTGCSHVRDHWHVVRSDGTDCYFQMARARLSHEITAKDGGHAASAMAGVVGVDAGLLADEAELARLARRARRQAQLALGLLTAPALPGGSYKLVLDFALAKGLAHEAFGHAAESDAMDTSILGLEGKFRAGERVAPDYVSIVDGPLEGDYAYQPISANGEVRRTVRIVKDGLLNEALADTFSARRAGVEPSGAARVESYACLPMPRMTNTRIEVRDPIPLATDFDDVTPAELREVLLANGLMQPGEHVLYLTGYKGGQVNTTLGDFVFNCAAIYDMADLKLYQPAIFSGKVLSVLGAILAGIGDPLTNAPGMCGKRGQSVPSSGGCHAFLVVDAHPDVKVGGKA